MEDLDKKYAAVLGPPEMQFIDDDLSFPRPNPRVFCNDGFSVSIQANEFTYCNPRNNEGPYDAYELGFPSEPEPLIERYAEKQETLTDTVYPYVPREVVIQVLEKHGGVSHVKRWHEVIEDGS